MNHLSIEMFKSLAFFSYNKDYLATIDEISHYTQLPIDKVERVVDDLIEQQILTRNGERVLLEPLRYQQFLRTNIEAYDPLIHQLEQVKDRYHHVVLNFEKKDDFIQLDKPTLIFESISSDKKFIANRFQDIPNLKVHIYTTAEIMTMLIDKDRHMNDIKTGLLLR